MTASVMEAEQTIELSNRKIISVLIGVIAGMFLSVLDQTVVGAALPTIVGDLKGVGDQQWVTTVYILLSAIILPICGKLGDRLGHKSLFIGSIVVFMLGTVVCGLAIDIQMLIIGRSIQGLGGGGLMILALSVMSHLASPDRMRKFAPIFGLTFGVSFAVGPLIGGALSSNWRWVFWLNIPVGLIALILVWFLVPKIKPEKILAKFDTLGAILLSMASIAIVLITSWGGHQYAWDSIQIILLIAGMVLSVLGFVVVERRAADPIMPGSLFKNRNFTIVTAAGFILGVVLIGTMAYLPTYFQMATGKSTTLSGVYMLPMVAGMIVVGNIVTVIVTKTKRYKWAPLVGMVVMGVGLALLYTLQPTTAIWHVCVYLGIMGIGIGMTMQTLMSVVRNEVPLKQAGTGNATNIYFRTIGTSIGAAVVGSVFTSNLLHNLTNVVPAGASIGGGGSTSLTPAMISSLPTSVREGVLSAYSSSLTPIFIWMVPLVIIGFGILWYLNEVPMRTSNVEVPIVEPLDTFGVAFVIPPREIVKTRREQWAYKARHRA